MELRCSRWMQNEELLALQTAHDRRLQRFQHLLEDHRLLQEQLRTFENGSSAVTKHGDIPSSSQDNDVAISANMRDPWYLQQEDLHGPAPWNELSQARRLCASLQKQL